MIDERPESGAFLMCGSEGWCCALPLEHIVETMRPLPVTPLAGAPAFVLGVSVVRGAPVPVVDLAQLLGRETQQRPGRFVTLKVGERRVALAVERVTGIRTLPDAMIHEIPPLLREASADVVAAIRTLHAELLLVIRSARLVPDSVWQIIDSAASRP